MFPETILYIQDYLTPEIFFFDNTLVLQKEC